MTPLTIEETLRGIANRKQRKFDTQGLFWSVLIGIIIGSMFCIGYLIKHH